MNKLEELKYNLVEEINKRMIDKIIEPTNAELLIKLINNSDSETEALAIAELGTTYRRTGFHFDKRLEKMGSDIHYLVKNKELSFVSNENAITHKLIIGDNYDALNQLLITHKEKINLIYIDPPYASDSMGGFAKTNYTNAITRDNLLSMLYPRLQLAKQLLSGDGVIFCSIDDKNHAYLKCLIDEVFGEENFIGNIVWKSGGGKSDSNYLKNKKEYILAFRKSKSAVFSKKKSPIGNYKLIDENGDRYCKRQFDMRGLKYSKSLDYPIEAPDGTYIYAGKDFELWKIRQNGGAKVRDYCWTLSKEEFENRLNDNRIIFEKSNDGSWRVYYKSFYDGKESVFEDIFEDVSFYDKDGTQMGTSELLDIFGYRAFDYPKSKNLLKYLINLIPDRNIIVLDFFAGSGTTGQAVLELNKEDGGKRQFILCTNNEITDINPNGIAFDVTSKRLKRVMTGSCYDGTSDFKWNKNNKPLGDNLTVYDICSVNNTEYREGKSAFEVIDETLYDLPNFRSIEEKINWVCNNFEGTQKYLKEE